MSNYFDLLFIDKLRGVAVRKRPLTQNEAGSKQTERGEANYAVVRPTDDAADDDVSYDYVCPAASVPDDNNSRTNYLSLISEPDKQLRLLALFTRPETDNTTSVSGACDDVTKMEKRPVEDNGISLSDALDSAANEQQPATYIEII